MKISKELATNLIVTCVGLSIMAILYSGNQTPKTDWLTIETNDNTSFALKRSTIRHAGDDSTVWMRFTYLPHLPGNPAVKSALSETHVSCADKTIGNTKSQFYTASGQPIYAMDTGAPEMAPIPPGTVNERVWRILCSD